MEECRTGNNRNGVEIKFFVRIGELKIMMFQLLFRNACYGAAGLSALFVAGGIQAKQKTQTVMLIENVTAIDAKNGSRSHVDVRMSGGTITSVSPHASWKLKSGTKRIDGAGKFLIPGLWDVTCPSYIYKRG